MHYIERVSFVSLTFYCYPKCGTCKKAKLWLDQSGLEYTEKHIVDDVPTVEVLTAIIERSGLELKKFFNTSGLKYRELNLKERFSEMDKSELISLLASDGMLIKRPLTFNDQFVTLGFKEDAFIKTWRSN